MSISPAGWYLLSAAERSARLAKLRRLWQSIDDNPPQAGRQPNERSEAGGTVHHDDPDPESINLENHQEA